MSLDVVLLEKLAKWRPDSAHPSLDVTDAASGWSATITAQCVDVVGARLVELALRPTADAPAVDVKARAEQLCRRVTGLLEPLALVEVDGVRNVAQLRSEQPGQLGDDRFYYEILLEGDGRSTVRRFQAPRADTPRRQQVPFALTHEVLARLVRELSA